MDSKLPSIERIKREAAKLKKEHGIKHSHAIEIVARSYGFNTYAAARAALLNQGGPHGA